MGSESARVRIAGGLIIVGLLILLSMLQDYIPNEHHTVPKIVIFYMTALTLATLSIVLSALVGAFGAQGHRRRPVPAWISSLCFGRFGLRRLLLMDTYSTVNSFDPIVTMKAIGNIQAAEVRHADRDLADGISSSGNERLQEISRYLHSIVSKMAADEAYKKIVNEWQDIGCVFDRLLLVLFAIIFVLTSIILLA